MNLGPGCDPANNVSESVYKEPPWTTHDYMLAYNKRKIMYMFIYFIDNDN